MNLARMVRNEVRKIRNSDYVLASRCMGGGFLHILRWHLVPNFLPSVMFMIISSIGSAILMESTLSFLGLGLPVESISWGSMLSLSQRALLTNSWWVILMPGLFIISTLLCITNIGHYLRRTADRNESNL
jgi:peptide/nickel transport system permease protein